MIRSEGNLTPSAAPDINKPTARRMTVSTVMTTSSSEFSDNDEANLSELREQSNGMVTNLIKNEMVQSLTRIAAARMRQKSGDGTVDGTNMKDAEAAIRKLATMVLDGEDETGFSSAKDENLKPDGELRDLLRQALVVGDGNESLGEITQAALQDSALDIWHADYWTPGETSLHTKSDMSDSNNLDLSTSTHTFSIAPSRSSGVHTESDESGESQSLQEFLANLKEFSSDSDASDDDVSVLSDITGLTDVFPEDEDRKVKAKAARSKVLLESLPVTKDLSSQHNRRENRKVWFGEVTVRKYQRILCDNPACTAGPSLGVGWNYKAQVPIKVDAYEKMRGNRRQKNELLLDRETREKMVRRMGYSERDIALMVRNVNKTKHQRRQTLNNMGVEKMEIAVETAKKRLKSFLFLKGKGVTTNY